MIQWLPSESVCMLLLPAETLTRKHSHADSLGRKPLFADRSLGRKQESLDNLSRSRIKRTLSAGRENTLKCLSIGTPKTISFPFVSNGKLIVFMCPNIHAYYNEAIFYLNFGTPKNNEFSIWNKWKIYYF